MWFLYSNIVVHKEHEMFLITNEGYGQRFFPIEKLVLPIDSSIVEFNFKDEESFIVRFNSASSHLVVYEHINSFLLGNGYSITPESDSFSNEIFNMLYDSSDSRYSVLFVHCGKFPKHLAQNRPASYARYAFSVFENP